MCKVFWSLFFFLLRFLQCARSIYLTKRIALCYGIVRVYLLLLLLSNKSDIVLMHFIYSKHFAMNEFNLAKAIFFLIVSYSMIVFVLSYTVCSTDNIYSKQITFSPLMIERMRIEMWIWSCTISNAFQIAQIVFNGSFILVIVLPFLILGISFRRPVILWKLIF